MKARHEPRPLDLRGLLDEFRQIGPVNPRGRGRPRKKGECLLELSIFDLHLGKLAWAPEAGRDYDMKISEELFRDAVNHLVALADSFPVGQILFPIGNDFFNVNNALGTTAAGTAQDEDGRWQKSFCRGRRIMAETIGALSAIAPITVKVVAGNHDPERMFYLGEVLDAYFHRNGQVTVDNAPALRKYHRYGANLLGFTHGDSEKHANLPLIMATERPEEWAVTKFREFHLGHFHSKKDRHSLPCTEHNGVRVRIIPSLCPADAWHRKMGYNGLRAAEAYVWHEHDGCVATFSHSPQ